MPDVRPLPLLVTCADGLESLLAEEIRMLGGEVTQQQAGRLSLTGPLSLAYRLCLWSRLASRVLLPIHRVEQPWQDERDIAEELYQAALAFDWSLIFSPASTFAIRLHTERGVKVNAQFATLRAKDGVVDAFMDACGRRPSIDSKHPEITLHVSAGLREHVFSLDLSGDSLHRRGYRQAMTEAPLKENLAAALLMAAGWPHPDWQTLIDPMCGSGTLLIEALMMSTQRAPGLTRRFGFLGWSGHDAALWKALLDEARSQHAEALNTCTLRVFGFDADWQAIQATRQNLIAAGLERLLPLIRLEERTLADWPDFGLEHPDQALLITNPPYGERLGDKASNRALYQGLGLRLQQHLPQQHAAVVAAQIEQADVLPLQDPQTLRLMNGNLPIYLRSGRVQRASPPPFLLRDWTAQPVSVEGAQDFANRLSKNLQQCKKLALREGVSNLRVYDADLPDFNLAVDLYGDLLHVQEYAPPKSIDPEKAQQRFKLALQAVRAVTGLPREQVFIKTRARQTGNAQYEKKSDGGKRFVVQEGAARLYVNLSDYLDTGLFLDHRPIRQRIHQEARGKHFLNLYAYTCTASVQAALGGAASTTSVDLSATYLEWGKNNFALNGLTVDHADGQHQFFESDIFEWLKTGSEQYDLIFIDPPTFSNSKKFSGTFDVQRDHVSLIKRAMNRLHGEGVLYFSNNFRRFELDEALTEWFELQEISAQTIGFDFRRNERIHRAWRITHRQR